MVTDAGEVVVCANPDCRVEESGACVEGFDKMDCPHYGLSAGEHANGAEAQSDVQQTTVVLPGADALTPVEASGVLGAGDARVVGLLGPVNSGKTSLIASLYDLFQEDRVGQLGFARSRTLHAFERACHDARSASRREHPSTNRTARGDVRFYHLGIAGEAAAGEVALLLGDRSGEEYEELTNEISSAADFCELRRADSLSILVDGERLVDAATRHVVYNEALLLLQALHDSGHVRRGLQLAVVLTKLDVVKASTVTERAEGDYVRLVAQLRRLFGHFFAGIEPFRIAASPKTRELTRGAGVAQLLSFWLTRRENRTDLAVATDPVERAFGRLTPVDDSSELAHG